MGRFVTKNPRRKEDCADVAGHTECPAEYIAWHLWAEEMAKTHRQKQCPTCGLFAIWVPKRGTSPAQPSPCPPPSVSSEQKQSTEVPSSPETEASSQSRDSVPQ